MVISIKCVIMRILHICLSAFFIDNYSYQENILPKFHVKQGHDVTVIASLFTFDNDGKGTYLPKASAYMDANGFKVIRLAFRKPHIWNKFFRHYKGLRKNIEEIQPDVIFVHNASFGDTPIIRDYLKSHPNVILYADSHVDYINSAKNWMSKYILHPIIWRHYSKVIEPYMTKCYGVTPLRCRFLKEVYKVNPQIVEYLPLGVDDDLIPSDRAEIRKRIREELSIGDEDFLIFTGGKIDRLKNTHILIDALDKVNSANLHLVICGVLTPQMEYLLQTIETNPNIHYLGWCDAERVMNCMVAADLACFPGTHSTLWEQSVGVGLPAIFKKWDEMEHVNVNGNCVFVEGGNSDELAEVIKKMTNVDVYSTFKTLAQMAANTFLYSQISKKAIDMC